MLKLNALYSNKPDIFPDISFHDGLNIVYAAVGNTGSAHNTHSHSVGKTTLMRLINFCLMGKLTKSVFLKKHQEKFADYCFYLEIQTAPNTFVTIRRDAFGKTSLATCNAVRDFRGAPDDAWSYVSIGFDRAKRALAGMLSLDAVEHLDATLRHGLRYCFRGQGEYQQTFKVNTAPELHSNWKPYLCGLLGIDHKIVSEKLANNDTINKLRELISAASNISNVSSQAIEAEIQLTENRISQLREQIDSFNFQQADQNDIKLLVHDLDQRISELNHSLYTTEHQLKAINESLHAEFSFNLEQIAELFNEIELHLPDKLVKSYDQLIELNKSLTVDRNQRLARTRVKLEEKQRDDLQSLTALNAERAAKAKLLLDEEAFERYKSLEREASGEEVKLAELRSKLERLDASANLKEQLAYAEIESQKLTIKLEKAVRQIHNKKLKAISNTFTGVVRSALELDAFLYIDLNEYGNPEFHIKLNDHTSQDEGESYRQIISACFDVSLLIHYSADQFYRFAYHDGLLESLDDRLKIKVLETWQSAALKYGLQLIVSLHDSDLPLDDSGTKRQLPEDLIIRKLHDKGDDGRLFKMPAF